MTFTIPTDHASFRLGLAEISLTEVAINVRGLKTGNNMVSIHLIQHGKSEFVDLSHRIVTFSHFSRPTQVIYDLRTGEPTSVLDNNLGQDGTYAGLSPFATWSLVISKNENVAPDFSGVTEIELQFSGLFFPFP